MLLLQKYLGATPISGQYLDSSLTVESWAAVPKFRGQENAPHQGILEEVVRAELSKASHQPSGFLPVSVAIVCKTAITEINQNAWEARGWVLIYSVTDLGRKERDEFTKHNLK